MLSRGDPAIFFTRPISGVFLLAAAFLLFSPLFTRERIGKKAIEMQAE
jgi:TctA family transporter